MSVTFKPIHGLKYGPGQSSFLALLHRNRIFQRDCKGHRPKKCFRYTEKVRESVQFDIFSFLCHENDFMQ